MSPFFTRERFGQPQVIAGVLLLVFLAQCLWLVGRRHPRNTLYSADASRIREGLRLWGRQEVGWTAYSPTTHPKDLNASSPPDHLPSYYDPHHSALWYLIAAAPLLVWPGTLEPETLPYVDWLASVPYLLFGVLLGASLWYVSRRLYGNAGGYIALMLYCFAPGIVRVSAVWLAQPETGAAWGAFGAIFTAIAVAHTLYAPREVVLWNWRRIFLLGLSFALAVGSQFSLIVTIPLALAFMLYLAPARRSAAIVIWVAACVIGPTLLFASYFFHLHDFWQGMRHAAFLGITWQAFRMPGALQHVATQLAGLSPALVLALPVALITYFVWPRARYFGNTAPLLVAAVFLLMAILTPHYPGLGFQLAAIPFLFVFVAGVFADLLETRMRALVLACVCGLLGASALWNLLELARVPRS